MAPTVMSDLNGNPVRCIEDKESAKAIGAMFHTYAQAESRMARLGSPSTKA